MYLIFVYQIKLLCITSSDVGYDVYVNPDKRFGIVYIITRQSIGPKCMKIASRSYEQRHRTE